MAIDMICLKCGHTIKKHNSVFEALCSIMDKESEFWGLCPNCEEGPKTTEYEIPSTIVLGED